jgi:hypothetical protein
MPYDDLKFRVVSGLFDIAGNFISGQLTKPNYDEQEKILDNYYRDAIDVTRKAPKKFRPLPPPMPEPVQDLTSTKIEGGTACLPCSRDHFSTVSGALNEALRFARKEGMRHPEVEKRIGLALDELNSLERLDLSAENIVKLEGKEKQLAVKGLDDSRNLRHKITTMREVDDLEQAAAEASTVRTEFMRNLWGIVTVDGTIDKLCKGLSDEERTRCISTINQVLIEKKETPP